MKFFQAAFLSLLATTAVAHDRLIVTNDLGGPIFQRSFSVENIRKSGTMVVLDGVCASACTMYLKLLETNQLCTTKRTELMFHAPYYILDEKALTRAAAIGMTKTDAEKYMTVETKLARKVMLMHYPENFRKAIAALLPFTSPSKFVTIAGTDLIPECQ